MEKRAFVVYDISFSDEDKFDITLVDYLEIRDVKGSVSGVSPRTILSRQDIVIINGTVSSLTQYKPSVPMRIGIQSRNLGVVPKGAEKIFYYTEFNVKKECSYTHLYQMLKLGAWEAVNAELKGDDIVITSTEGFTSVKGALQKMLENPRLAAGKGAYNYTMLDRKKGKGGAYEQYYLIDDFGKDIVVDAKILKDKIFNHEVNVRNLTLTGNNALRVVKEKGVHYKVTQKAVQNGVTWYQLVSEFGKVINETEESLKEKIEDGTYIVENYEIKGGHLSPMTEKVLKFHEMTVDEYTRKYSKSYVHADQKYRSSDRLYEHYIRLTSSHASLYGSANHMRSLASTDCKLNFSRADDGTLLMFTVGQDTSNQQQDRLTKLMSYKEIGGGYIKDLGVDLADKWYVTFLMSIVKFYTMRSSTESFPKFPFRHVEHKAHRAVDGATIDVESKTVIKPLMASPQGNFIVHLAEHNVVLLIFISPTTLTYEFVLANKNKLDNGLVSKKLVMAKFANVIAQQEPLRAMWEVWGALFKFIEKNGDSFQRIEEGKTEEDVQREIAEKKAARDKQFADIIAKMVSPDQWVLQFKKYSDTYYVNDAVLDMLRSNRNVYFDGERLEKGEFVPTELDKRYGQILNAIYNTLVKEKVGTKYCSVSVRPVCAAGEVFFLGISKAPENNRKGAYMLWGFDTKNLNHWYYCTCDITKIKEVTRSLMQGAIPMDKFKKREYEQNYRWDVFDSLTNDLSYLWTHISKNCDVFNEGHYTEGWFSY